jgi:hypothetical protein
MPITWITRVNYDKDREVLRCEGVMPEDLQKDLLRQATTDGFRSAIYRLAALSHLAPVTDRYGYNAMVASPEYVVSDLMLRTLLSWNSQPDEIRVQIPVESKTFLLVIHPQKQTASLFSMDDRQLVREGRYESVRSESSTTVEQCELEVSNMDQQIVVAINGVSCFDPFLITSEVSLEETLEASVSSVAGEPMDAARAAQIAIRMEQQKRWAIGVAGTEVKIHDLEMYRDVFYTPGRRRNAIESEFTVPTASYFVQGDNSPVSSDSRNWINPCVPHHLLIGKPFLVHLPSRPAVLQFGGQQWPIRIPEWSRIRYIR